MCLSAVGTEPPQLSVSEERHLAILTELPFVVPFEERVKVLHYCLTCLYSKHVVCCIGFECCRALLTFLSLPLWAQYQIQVSKYWFGSRMVSQWKQWIAQNPEVAQQHLSLTVNHMMLYSYSLYSHWNLGCILIENTKLNVLMCHYAHYLWITVHEGAKITVILLFYYRQKNKKKDLPTEL